MSMKYWKIEGAEPFSGTVTLTPLPARWKHRILRRVRHLFFHRLSKTRSPRKRRERDYRDQSIYKCQKNALSESI